MKPRRVRFLSRAVSDLTEIGEYLAIEAPEAKERLLGRIVDAAEGLSTFGERGPIARDPVLRARSFRSLRVGRYVVFYKLTPTTARIYRVLHERRDWAHLLR